MQKNKLWLAMVPMLSVFVLPGCEFWDDDDDDDELVCEAPQVPNDDGSACVDPPPTIDNPPPNPGLDVDPPGETVTAGAMEIVINLVDPDASPTGMEIDPDSKYANWSLHLFNEGDCNEWPESQLNDGWTDQSIVPENADDYGPYWVLDVLSESGCVNLIFRDENLNQSQNISVDMDEFTDRTVAFSGFDTTVYDTREDAFNSNPPGLNTSARDAHWVDESTILWDETGSTFALYVSTAADFGFNSDGTLTGSYDAYELTPGDIAEDTAAKFPHIDDRPAYMLPSGFDAKAALKGQLYVAALAEEGWITDVSKLHIQGALDDVYTSGEDDANEQYLGVMLGDEGTSFALWAPTAQAVNLHLFALADKAPIGEPIPMTEDENGIWHASAEAPHGTFYKYEITGYYYQNDQINTLIVSDPYSVSLSMNSEYSQVVDFSDPSITPEGWADHEVPTADTKNISIYESHIRDFSAHDESTSAVNRGKYLAFTETESDPMQHVKMLQMYGLTHFHLLPAFDIATIDEDPTKRVDITDTVGDLCAINSGSALCSNPADTVLEDLLEACDPATQCAETIVDDIRGLDSFNWGYDPFHYGVPEGSYSSNPDGYTRILEFRQMVQALHGEGLRVVMDVVYNHTNASGITSEKSVLDKVVPGYYHRYNVDTGEVERSTCCDNTATEFAMMEKLMTDTLVIWARDYKIDSFRFDLMGHQPLDAMERSLVAVQAVDSDTYFYGEGWNFGEVENDRIFEQATQLNLAGTGIGSFSDRGRDAIRGGSPFDSGSGIRSTQGVANGLWSNPNEANTGSDTERSNLLHFTDIIRVELTGGLADFALIDSSDETVRGSGVDYNGQPAGYTESPTELLTYVSKHDNQTLWDNNQYKLPTGTLPRDRARYQNFALSFPLMGQSIPFVHMGSDLLRSKSMERDSFDSGDWFNYVDFTGEDNNWNVGLPSSDKDSANYELIGQIIADTSTVVDESDIGFTADVVKEYLQIRQSSPLFTLGTKEAVMGRVDFHNTGSEQAPGVVVMSIDDGTNAGADLDPDIDAFVIIFNSTDDDFTFPLGGLSLHPVQEMSVDSDIASIAPGAESVTVPAVTTAILWIPQGDSQGAGIPVAPKSFENFDPFTVPVFVRGSFNEFGTSDQAKFTGFGTYTGVVDVSAGGDYEFKFASSDWSTVDIGYNDMTVQGEGSLDISAGEGGNIAVSIPEAGLWAFKLDVSDSTEQVITVYDYGEDVEPFEATAYIRGFLGQWDPVEANALEYMGLGVYSVTIDPGEMVTEEMSTSFKVGDASWDVVNYGVETDEQKPVTLGVAKEMYADPSSKDMTVDVEPEYAYTFLVDAFYENKVTVTVTAEATGEPEACVEMSDSTDAGPIGMNIALIGNVSDWQYDSDLAFSYKGDNIYQLALTGIAIRGADGFKMRGEESWDTQFAATVGSASVTDVEADVTYDLTGAVNLSGINLGNNNTSVDTSAGTYLYQVTIDADANLSVEAVQGSFRMCQIMSP